MPVLVVSCAGKIPSASAALLLSVQAGNNLAFEGLQNRQLRVSSSRSQSWIQRTGKLAKQADGGKVCG